MARKTSARLHRPDLGGLRAPQGQLAGRLLWGGVIAGGLVWLAWPAEETGAVLLSRGDCATIGNVSQAECEAGYDQAVADHQRLAPRFDSLAQCQEQFGACYADPANALYWIPPFGGVLLGYRQRDDDAGGGQGGGYRYTGTLPLYRERGGDFLNPRGTTSAPAPAGSPARPARPRRRRARSPSPAPASAPPRARAARSVADPPFARTCP